MYIWLVFFFLYLQVVCCIRDIDFVLLLTFEITMYGENRRRLTKLICLLSEEDKTKCEHHIY